MDWPPSFYELRRGEGCPKRLRFDPADVGVVESSKDLSGQIVIATSLHCG